MLILGVRPERTGTLYINKMAGLVFRQLSKVYFWNIMKNIPIQLAKYVKIVCPDMVQIIPLVFIVIIGGKYANNYQIRTRLEQTQECHTNHE